RVNGVSSGSVLFFFSSRRRHTRFSRDWSSDVCSSDLPQKLAGKVVKDEESWSRIKSPTPKQFFPQDKLIDFMNMAQNEVPLIWRSEERRVGKECRGSW